MTVNVPLELPDASKAFVVCYPRFTGDNAQNRVSCTLSNNQLAIKAGGILSSANLSVMWFVAEFESGVSVQRGTMPFSTAGAETKTATITAVDCTKSFVLMAGSYYNNTGSAAGSADDGMLAKAILGNFTTPCPVTAGSTTSTVTLRRLDFPTNPIEVNWQVVTMDGATVVARGAATLSSGASLTSPTFSPAVEPTKSFVIMSQVLGTAVGGAEAEYQARADLANCTGTPTACNQVTFTRISTTTTSNHQIEMGYEVVRLDDGGSVQRGSTTTASGTQMGSSGNITAVDRAATVPIFTASGGSSTTNTWLDETSWTPWFPTASTTAATNQLQFTRGTATTSFTADARWFAVSLYKCANSRLCSVDATAGNATATVKWSPIYDPVCVSGSTPTACETLVVRDTATISWTPTNTTTYTVGTQPSGGPASMRVVFNGSGQTFTDNSVTNGQRYFYRVYGKQNGATNYITDAMTLGTTTTNQVDVTPGTTFAWSFATTGGSTLNAPVAGDGKVYVASNANKLLTLDSATGLLVAQPVIANGAVQSYLSWFPESGGTSEGVVAGDQKGFLTSMDGVTGARNWAIEMPDTVIVGAGAPLQAAMAIQLRAYTLPPYQCDAGAFAAQYTTATQDLILIASRNTDRTKNQIWAVRADTDGITPAPIVWTYPVTAGTPAMDRATGQPYVDYCRNRLWVSTGNNASQHSLWVIDTLTGAKITSFPSFGDQTNSSPTLSYDGTTVYVGDAAGKLYAVDAATTGTTAKYTLQLPGTSPQITGFIWEDGTASPRRLYIPVLTNGNAGIWCVQDNGSALSACPGWSVNPRPPVAGGTPNQPLMSDTAIFYPASNGNIYQINPADGTLVGSAFTVESGAQLGGISTEDLTQLYVGTSTGKTYRINLNNGNLP